MTDARLALSELLEKAGDGDFLRTVAEAVLQLLTETDVDGLIVSANFGTRSGECLRLERNDALRRAWIVALRAVFSSVSRCFGAERVQRS